MAPDCDQPCCAGPPDCFEPLFAPLWRLSASGRSVAAGPLVRAKSSFATSPSNTDLLDTQSNAPRGARCVSCVASTPALSSHKPSLLPRPHLDAPLLETDQPEPAKTDPESEHSEQGQGCGGLLHRTGRGRISQAAARLRHHAGSLELHKRLQVRARCTRRRQYPQASKVCDSRDGKAIRQDNPKP